MKFHFLFAALFTLAVAACGSANPTAAPGKIAAPALAPTNTAESGGSSAANNPADAAKAYFVALYSGVATDQMLCSGNPTVTAGLKQMGDAVSAGIAAGNVKADMSGLTYETSNQTGDSADVKVSGKITTSSVAGTAKDSVFPPQILKMKNDNGWKVCGMGQATQ